MNKQDELEELNNQMGKLFKAIPEVLRNFNHLHEQGLSDGALSAKQKELMAVSIAVAIRCSHCIVFHVNGALQKGASRQEVLEAISVAIVMGGGPAVAYGTEALKVLDDLLEKK